MRSVPFEGFRPQHHSSHCPRAMAVCLTVALLTVAVLMAVLRCTLHPARWAAPGVDSMEPNDGQAIRRGG